MGSAHDPARADARERAAAICDGRNGAARSRQLSPAIFDQERIRLTFLTDGGC